jgi:hypothetical protein
MRCVRESNAVIAESVIMTVCFSVDQFGDQLEMGASVQTPTKFPLRMT